jgi:propionyl-CoA carboxylase beta chain
VTADALDNIVRMTTAADNAGADTSAPNIHTTAGKLQDLRNRLEEAKHPVGEAAVEKTHAKGKLTARERITHLLDEGSFVELDALARHRSTNFGLADKRPLGDGVVTGYGTIDGRDGLHLQPGPDGLRRQPRRGLRREDREGHGPRGEDRTPADRHQ